MTAREDIAAAVNTVLGLNCSPYSRPSKTAGEAWVRLERMDRNSSRLGFNTTWQVWVVLPTVLNQAEKWIDDHAEEIASALKKELIVTSITPVEMTVESATVNGLVIEGTR